MKECDILSWGGAKHTLTPATYFQRGQNPLPQPLHDLLPRHYIKMVFLRVDGSEKSMWPTDDWWIPVLLEIYNTDWQACVCDCD